MSVVSVILAGGFGTRLGQVVRDVPKPMIEVAGAPFLEWVLRFLEANGLDRHVVCTGYRGEVIEDFIARRDGGRGLGRCIREEEPLGTGGAFLRAARTFEAALHPEAWLVLNGDSLILTPLAPLLALVPDRQWQGGLLGIEMADASRYGSLEVNARGGLACFKEKAPGAGLINGGLYLFKKRILDSLHGGPRLSMEEEMFPFFLRRQMEFRVIAVEAPFIDIGTPASLAEADAFIRTHQPAFQRAATAS